MLCTVYFLYLSWLDKGSINCWKQTNSVTRFGEISPLWQKFRIFWQFFIFGKVLNPLSHNFDAFGHFLTLGRYPTYLPTYHFVPSDWSFSVAQLRSSRNALPQDKSFLLRSVFIFHLKREHLKMSTRKWGKAKGVIYNIWPKINWVN